MENVSSRLFYVCDWEANGYDDSDGDILVYNADTKKIEHNPWSTRFYAPCNTSLTRLEKYQKGIECGVFTMEELKKSLFDDTFYREGESVLNMNNIIRCSSYFGSDIFLPVVVNEGRGYRGKGILVRSWEVDKQDPWGRDRSVRYGLIYNEKTNSLHKTRLKNIEFDSEALSMEEIMNRLYDSITIDKIVNYISSVNSCSSYRSDWVSKDVLSVICPFYVVDISTATDKTVSDKVREKARVFIEEKTKEIREWASSLGDKSEEEIDKIVERTLIKYYYNKLALL